MHIIAAHGDATLSQTRGSSYIPRLTHTGERSLYELGIWARRAYSANLSLLVDAPRHVDIRSSAKVTTLTSASTFALALMPRHTRLGSLLAQRTEGTFFHEELDQAKQKLEAGAMTQLEFDAELGLIMNTLARGGSMLPATLTPANVAIRSVAKKNDRAMEGSDLCPAYDAALGACLYSLDECVIP